MPEHPVLCSTVIPTVNRPTLERAVESVLRQDFDRADFEVIVVNDSGWPLPDEPWHRSARVRVIATNRRERSVARNTGAAIARGEYLHFLDDDDVLLPGAMNAFHELQAQTRRAVWLFGGYQAVDNDGALVREFRPALAGNIFAQLVSGESIPLQASWVRADVFFTVGAFDPAMTGVEDRDLGRRLALLGEVARLDCVVASIRIGEAGSTTDWSSIAAIDRRGREKALSTLGAYRRLRAGADAAFWRGRVAGAFLASSAWNAKHGQWMTALERATAGVGMSGVHVVRPGFWRGLRTRPGAQARRERADNRT